LLPNGNLTASQPGVEGEASGGGGSATASPGSEGEKRGKVSLPMQHWHAIGDGGKLQAYS